MEQDKVEPSPHLLGLPVEIRLQIYDYVFTVPDWESHRMACFTREPERTNYCTHCWPCSVLSAMKVPLRYPPTRVMIDPEGVAHTRRFMPPTGRSCQCNPPDPWAREERSPFRLPERLKRSSLLSVCKKISSEAKDVLYDNTLFLVTVYIQKPRFLFRVRGTYWRDPIAIKSATQLQHIRHLHMVLQIREQEGFKEMTPALSELVDILPPFQKLKSTDISIDAQGFERGFFGRPMCSEKGATFFKSLSGLPFGDEVRLLCSHWALADNDEKKEILRREVGEWIRVVRVQPQRRLRR